MSLREMLWQLLAFGALPAWLLAGVADWLCHRRTEIENTSGSRESAFHLLLYAQIAVPVVLGMWLEINAGMLVFMAACVAAHMLTSLHDTRYSQPRRFISPTEQMVHSWLEMLPLFALVSVVLLEWQAFTEPRWLPELRAQPVPGPWRVLIPVVLVAGSSMIFEEYLRGRRAQRLTARQAPSAAPRP